MHGNIFFLSSIIANAFFDKSGRTNNNLKPISSNANKIASFLAEYQVSFRLDKFIPLNIGRYFYYSGSFTSPACEGQYWIIANRLIEASQSQISNFEQLVDFENKNVSSFMWFFFLKLGFHKRDIF